MVDTHLLWKWIKRFVAWSFRQPYAIIYKSKFIPKLAASLVDVCCSTENVYSIGWNILRPNSILTQIFVYNIEYIQEGTPNQKQGKWVTWFSTDYCICNSMHSFMRIICQYLLTSSCHPPHIKDNIPFSLAYRIVRICSEEETRDKRLEELKNMLLSREYKNKLIENI